MNLLLRDEILAANFRPSEAAAQFETTLKNRLGGPHRYEVVRLMLGRSLADGNTPRPVTESERAAKGDLRGRELFGTEVDLWMGVFALDGKMQEACTLEDFKAAVEAHWSRGSALLKDDLERSGGDIVQLATGVANLLPGPAGAQPRSGAHTNGGHAALSLRVGPLSENAETGEAVEFVLNRSGSPHIVLMGQTGKGKTRVGVEMAKQILAASGAPLIYIDPKPDFAPGGNYHGTFNSHGATTLIVGQQPIPIDFMPRADRGTISLQAACMRLRDSICRSTPAASSIQRDRLLTCIEHVARNDRDRSLERIAAEYESALESEGIRGDSISSLLSELTRFRAFAPEIRAEDFFQRSWVLSLSPVIPDSFKTLIMQLLLDAEAAHWLNQEDAPLVESHRPLRHLLVIQLRSRRLGRALGKGGTDLRVGEVLTQILHCHAKFEGSLSSHPASLRCDIRACSPLAQ